MRARLGRIARRAGVALGMRTLALAAARVAWPPGAPRVVQVTVNGCRLLVLANEDVGRRIAALRRYEPADTALLARLVRGSDICFDIGANTGYYTMLLASLARQGEVHAFEPVPLNWHLLQAGALLNGFAHVRANHAALGDRDGELDFSVAVDGAYSSIVPVGRKHEAARVRVTVSRLDAYLEAHAVPRVDIVKMDVEGAEPLVLEGAGALLADEARSPRVLMLELYGPNLRPYGADVAQVLERMARYGYSPWCAGAGEGLQRFGPAQFDICQNVFFVRRREDLG